MKKILLISIFTIICQILFSQNQYVDRFDPYFQFVESAPVKCKFPKNIKTVILEQNEDDVETNFVKNMDELGRLYEYHTEPEGKGEHVSYTCSFSDGNASTGTYTMYASNGGVEYTIVHINNEDGNPVSQIKKTGKGKLLEEITWGYDDNGLLTHTTFVVGEKKQLVNEWFYIYNSELNMSESSIQDSKGRTVHKWLYNCDKEQKTMNVEKSCTYICSWESETGEFKEKNEQRFDEKGGEKHHIWRYTETDTTICVYLIYNETNKLDYKVEYNHSEELPLVIKKFKDGKVDNKGVYKYTDGLMTNYSEYDSGNQLVEHHLYIYNDEGFMTRARIYNDKNDNEKTIVIKHKSSY